MISVILKAEITDLESVAQLFDEYRVFYEKKSDIEAAKTFLSERMANNESVIFISKSDQGIEGFVQLYPLFSSTRMKRLWLLNDLYVDQNCRGRGVAKALINRVKAFCHETNACGFMLETAKTNTAANKLYVSTQLDLDEAHNYYSFDV